MEANDTLNPEVDAAPAMRDNPTPEERLDAANREVAASFDASGDALEESGAPLQAEEAADIVLVDDTSAEEVLEDAIVEPDDEAEDQAAETTESEEPIEAEGETTPPDPAPTEIPPEIRAEYDRKMEQMDKGLQKRLRQLADKEKQLDTLILQNQHMMDSRQPPQDPNAVRTEGPPKHPGEGASEEAWSQYEDSAFAYRYNLMNAGQQQKMAVINEQQEMQNRYYLITNQPGVSEEVLLEMSKMAEGDERYLELYRSDEGAIRFFNEAKTAVDRRTLDSDRSALDAEKAEAAKATATRKAGAASRALARPGSAKAAEVPAESFKLEAFRDVDDALANINKKILSDVGL